MSRMQAALAGFRDGWSQPHDLSSTASVDWDVQEWLDWGANLGQFARAGFRSQSWEERYRFLPPK